VLHAAAAAAAAIGGGSVRARARTCRGEIKRTRSTSREVAARETAAWDVAEGEREEEARCKRSFAHSHLIHLAAYALSRTRVYGI